MRTRSNHEFTVRRFVNSWISHQKWFHSTLDFRWQNSLWQIAVIRPASFLLSPWQEIENHNRAEENKQCWQGYYKNGEYYVHAGESSFTWWLNIKVSEASHKATIGIFTFSHIVQLNVHNKHRGVTIHNYHTNKQLQRHCCQLSPEMYVTNFHWLRPVSLKIETNEIHFRTRLLMPSSTFTRPPRTW